MMIRFVFVGVIVKLSIKASCYLVSSTRHTSRLWRNHSNSTQYIIPSNMFNLLQASQPASSDGQHQWYSRVQHRLRLPDRNRRGEQRQRIQQERCNRDYLFIHYQQKRWRTFLSDGCSLREAQGKWYLRETR